MLTCLSDKHFSDKHLACRTLPEERRGTCRGAVGPGAEYRDEIARFRVRKSSLVCQTIERRAQAADDRSFLVWARIEPGGDGYRVVAANDGPEIA